MEMPCLRESKTAFAFFQVLHSHALRKEDFYYYYIIIIQYFLPEKPSGLIQE